MCVAKPARIRSNRQNTLVPWGFEVRLVGTYLMRFAGCSASEQFCPPIFAVAIGLFLPFCNSASADDFSWATPISRSFDQSFAWTPVGIPGPGDAVIFDLGLTDPAVRYGVILRDDESVQSVRVESDIVAIVPNGHLLTVDGEGYGLEVAPDANDLGNVSIIRNQDHVGTVRVTHDARVGVDPGSDGLLLINALFDVGGDLILADQGRGFFQTTQQGQTTIGGDMIVGLAANSDGTVLLQDAGSLLDVENTLRIGGAGEGQLQVVEAGMEL
mgnify:CR=1 FL=1